MRASARRIAIASDACERVRRGRALDLRCGAIVETSREVSEPSSLDELALNRELEPSAGPTRRGDDDWYRNRCSSRRARSSRFRRLWWSGFSIDGRFDRTNLNPRFSRFSFEEGSEVSEFNTPFEPLNAGGRRVSCFVFEECLVLSFHSLAKLRALARPVVPSGLPFTTFAPGRLRTRAPGLGLAASAPPWSSFAPSRRRRRPRHASPASPATTTRRSEG